MNPSKTPLFLSLILGALLLIGALPQAYWIAQSRDALVTQTIMDDAFYYFQTARNVAIGEGSVSSGGVRHNGYHPLWMLVCAGFFRWVPDDLMAIRLILVLGVILEILTALTVYRILRQLRCPPLSALFGMVCFHLNPWMQALTVCGLEAPLNALLLALTTSCAISLCQPGEMPLEKRILPRWPLLGILMGLTYLVRTDNIFFLGATVLLLIWRMRPWSGLGRGLLTAGFLAFLLALPWVLWNWHTFGSFVQGSASALPTVRRLAFFQEHPGAGEGALLLHRFQLLAGWFPAILYYSGLGSLWFLLLAAGGGVLAFARGRAIWKELAGALAALLPLALAVLALGIAHKFFRLATREWYYVTPNLFLALLGGWLAHFLTRFVAEYKERFTRLVPILPLIATCLVASLLGYKTLKKSRERLTRPPSYFLQILAAFEGVPDLRPGEALGITDSGTVGFFASHPALNLDGVVNPEAARAIQDGRLLDYVKGRGIRYLLITPRMFSERFWGKGFEQEIEPYPLLTPQGYRLKNEPTPR